MRKQLVLSFLLLMLVMAVGVVNAYEAEPFDGFPYDDQPEAKIEKDVIVVMGSGNFDPSRSSGSYLQAVTKLFEEQNPNIDVQLNYGSWGDLWKKVGVMLGNRKGPDLVVGPREYLFAQGRGGGQWEDILTVPDEYFLDELQKKVVGPAILESSRFPGREGYMVWPWTTYVDGTGVINAGLVREAGYDPMEIRNNGWTISQFIEISKKLGKDNAGAYFGPMGGGDGERFALTSLYTHDIPYHLRNHDFPPFIDMKTGDKWIDEEAWLKGFKTIQNMIYEEGVIPPNSVGVAGDEAREAFVTGKTLYVAAGPDILTQVDERNRNIANGKEEGEPVEALIVPRPRFEGIDWTDYPVRVFSYGYYSFKQEPYKGDAHTRNVFKFAKFLTAPVFQPILAHNNSIPPDMRIYKGESSWFPGILGTGSNAKYMMQIAEMWQPRMGIYFQMALTEKMRTALRKYNNEVVRPTIEAVFLNKITPEEALGKMKSELDKVYSKIPKGERLVENADKIYEDIREYAKKAGHRVDW